MVEHIRLKVDSRESRSHRISKDIKKLWEAESLSDELTKQLKRALEVRRGQDETWSFPLHELREHKPHPDLFLFQYHFTTVLDEIRDQHIQTREHLTKETTQVRHEILVALRENPAESLKLFSKFGVIAASFSLIVKAISGFAIINPLFAMFILFSSFAGWGMAVINQKTRRS